MTDNNSISSKHKINIIVFVALSLVLYILIGYFTSRTDTIQLLSYWSLLFIAYFYIISKREFAQHISTLIILGIAFRCIFLWSTPSLSDDYFRFIWDGYLWSCGVNPFSCLPTELPDISESNLELFSGLNSRYYYSVYPPVMQYIFRLAVAVSPDSITGSIIVMRAIIILSELGSLVLLKRLLAQWHISPANILIYALNPLIIIELSGNLHFEAVMIFFLLLAVFLLNKGKLLFSTIAFALSVCAKLIPLVLLPLMFLKLTGKRAVLYTVFVFIFSILLFIPFIDIMPAYNIGNSIALYFQKFEFNASIFYLVREICYVTKGYDVIQTAGVVLPFVFVVLYLLLLFRHRKAERKIFFELALIVMLMYYSLALVVHPWYLSTLIVCSVFTNYRFALLWSALAGFTYITYSTIPYSENLYVVLIEYLLVFGFAIYELRRYNWRFSN